MRGMLVVHSGRIACTTYGLRCLYYKRRGPGPPRRQLNKEWREGDSPPWQGRGQEPCAPHARPSNTMYVTTTTYLQYYSIGYVMVRSTVLNRKRGGRVECVCVSMPKTAQLTWYCAPRKVSYLYVYLEWGRTAWGSRVWWRSYSRVS